MLLRLIAPIRQFLLTLLLASVAMLVAPAVNATEAEVTSAKLEATDEGYRISASFSFELSHSLVDAISVKEIPLSFTTEVELTRPRWYWLDEKPSVPRKQSELPITLGPEITRRLLITAYNKILQHLKMHWL